MFINIASVGKVRLLALSTPSPTSDPERHVVLIDRETEYDRYVVWTLGEQHNSVTNEITLVAFNGGYFNTLTNAEKSFIERCGMWTGR